MAALADMGINKAEDAALAESLDQLFLPNRVRIVITLEDDDGGEYPLETQVELPMTDPLWY